MLQFVVPLPRIRYQEQGQVTGIDNTMVVGAPFELFEV